MQRSIIQKFKHLHLCQQANERAYLDLQKKLCGEMDGKTPKQGLIYSGALLFFSLHFFASS
jgi:hypothetical protein